MFRSRNLAPEGSLLQQRAVGAYLGLAVGDALGATVEFMTPGEIRAQYGVHDRLRGGGWLHLKPGAVTDDTTMALALGEAILAEKRLDAELAARAFDGWMRSKPVDIGNTVRRGLLHFRRTGVPLAPPSETDAGNGACMRLLPAVLATWDRQEEETRRAVLAQARVTHNNALSDAGCLAVAGLLRLALHGIGLPEWIRGPLAALNAAFPVFRFRTERPTLNPSGYIVETLQVVFQGVVDSDSFEEALITVVNRGGDADTTGAIAGMLAGALYGVKAIPARWLDALDPNVREACRRQALGLIGIQGGILRDNH
ncbi:MAG: ADP-ribosyl-[dinitrogen reductase] hydrolase [Magnetococcales bacterium]|nr:ADP-ribosyl-[dinitrogen reductase] hydrolase [Magnetococcales bacterium]